MAAPEAANPEPVGASLGSYVSQKLMVGEKEEKVGEIDGFGQVRLGRRQGSARDGQHPGVGTKPGQYCRAGEGWGGGF